MVLSPTRKFYIFLLYLTKQTKKKLKTRLLIIAIFVMFSATINAQVQGVIGYNLGFFSPRNTLFDIHEYKMNEAYPEGNFHMPNFSRGFNLGGRFGDENMFVELLISSNKIKSKTSDPMNVEGVEYLYKVKYSLNTFNIGFAAGNEYIKAGVSFDGGRANLVRKYDTKESFGSTEWKNFFNDKSTFHMGYTLFVVLAYYPVEIRPYFHSYIKPDDIGFGGSYAVSTTNIGVAVNFTIGEME